MRRLDFGGAADGREHACPGRFGKLHHGRSHAAGSAVDEDRLARLQACTAKQAQMRGDSRQRPGGRKGIALTGRRGVAPGSVDRRVLSKTTLSPEEPLVAAPDAVTDFELGGPRSNRRDLAGKVCPDDIGERERHGDRTGAEVRVNWVHCDCSHPHQELTWAGGGRGQLAHLNHCGESRFSDVCGAHRTSSFGGFGVAEVWPWSVDSLMKNRVEEQRKALASANARCLVTSPAHCWTSQQWHPFEQEHADTALAEPVAHNRSGSICLLHNITSSGRGTWRPLRPRGLLRHRLNARRGRSAAARSGRLRL